MTLTKYPSISIVVPSWNQGKFIRRTLLSILHQDYSGPVQVIVSDGGSTDETVDVLKEFGDSITWWSQKDKGYVDAVMKGVAIATGEILAIQSSDDYYLPDAFKSMADAFEKNPEAGFVSGGECSIDLSGKIISYSMLSGAITPQSILYKAIPPQHASFIKRKLFEEIGGLRMEVDMCADIDLWYRASHLQRGIHFSQIVAIYQLHPDQRTAVSDKWYPNLVKMIETTEALQKYSKVFRLNKAAKKDLFSYWEMNWTVKRDFKAGQKVAWKKALHLFQQSKRTNRMLAGILFPTTMKTDCKKGRERKRINCINSIN